MRGALFSVQKYTCTSSYSAYGNSDGYALTLYAFSEQPVHDTMVVTTVNAYYNRLILFPTHWYTRGEYVACETTHRRERIMGREKKNNKKLI